MTTLKNTRLFFVPEQIYVAAAIVQLTADAVQGKVSRWWTEPDLVNPIHPEQIDQHWNWLAPTIEFEDRHLQAAYIGIITVEDGDLQGAIQISTEPVPSVLEPSEQALFLERIFTAPRNRSYLRKDGKEFFKAVGLQLLTWGAHMSRDMGYEGRLRLDGSPDFVGWYEKRHLQKLDLEHNVFEDVTYTPMELPPSGAAKLLEVMEDL